MKRWLMVVVAATVLLAGVPLAFAAGGGAGQACGHHKFQLVGRVVSVDPVAGTVQVLVKAGTRSLGEARRGELTLTVSPGARVRLVTDEGCVTVGLDQIWPGAKLKAGGTIGLGASLETVYTATRLKARGGTEPAPTPDPAPAPDPAPTPDPLPDPIEPPAV